MFCENRRQIKMNNQHQNNMKTPTRVSLAMALFIVAALMAWPTGSSVQADVTLPSIISDHMVLQGDAKVAIWGWAAPGEKVTVKIAGQVHTVQADPRGTWLANLKKLKPGAKLEMTVTGTNTITVKDILVGEVWLCTGQSNMERPMSSVRDTAREISDANYPEIRLFTVPRTRVMSAPMETCGGKWVVCTPDSVPSFSAVGFLFGRELHKDLKRPIGLIHSAVGGTEIELWIDYKVYKAAVDAAGDAAWPPYDPQIAEANHQEALRNWAVAFEKAKALGTHEPDKPRKAVDPKSRKRGQADYFNGMIHPITRYAIRGAIWYQGEWNTWNAYWYRTLLPLMIKDWRFRWGQGDFPFGIVQLANHGDIQTQPVELSSEAEVREAQLLTLKRSPNTGLAVIIDTSEDGNLHPTNKQDVGHRLALWALAKVYGRENVYSGPVFDTMKIEKEKVRLCFKQTGGGLTAKGDTLTGFAIAGTDKVFYAAEATIEGSCVVVCSSNVAAPVAVRYGWANNPVCNLYNKEGLPASPFRTDDWPGITQPLP